MMIDDDDPVAWHGEDIEAEAARWFARHRADAEHPGDIAAFSSWSATPGARLAYDRVSQMWDAIGLLDGHPDLRAVAEPVSSSRRWWPWAAGITAVAASLAVVVMGPIRLDAPGRPVEQVATLHFASRVGERMPVALTDGSVVTLDTNSAIAVDMEPQRRLVTLTRGRAYFHVAKAPERPFVVRASGQSVVAVGTSFSVDAAAQGVEVVLVEGRVRVMRTTESATGNRVEMVAGDRLSVSRGGQLTLRRTDAARATAWLAGKLVFDEAPLRDVAAELNRYSTRKIVFADPATADRRISAVLGTGDIDSFVAAVETMRIGRARPGGTPDRVIIDRR